MVKKKTKKGTVKRIKVTGSGKLMRKKAGAGHLLGKKRAKRKRKLRKDTEVSKSFVPTIKNLINE